ncbi:glycosyl hydrolase family 38 protein [Ancylostoma duodenale]|uniref:Glycosyl hydrolase family 38 protein n=1 Tax=Ancylostoma duodenale TaxID=51022 RepID=A0A0C2CR38_9BILA|nr:glycosyl hydrolase family 38 protein [Ancylostoma duodenale]
MEVVYKQDLPDRTTTPQPSTLTPTEQPVIIQNEEISLAFDANGLVSTLTEKATNVTHTFRQEFFYYLGVMNGSQPSGAYVFRPTGQPIPIERAQLEVVKGPLVEEVRQTFSSWVAQIIRLRKNAKHVEFDWIIGPIPKEEANPITKEVVTRYITDIKNQDVFFTDSNGRQMMRRQKNYNPNFKYIDTEPVSGNYYPVTNRVFLKDDNKQLSILTDRSQGATSLDGGLELMLHRRCFADDHWGVEEALDEPGDGSGLVVRGTHYVLFGDTKLHRRCFADDHWGVEEALDEPGDGSGLVVRGTHYVLFGDTKVD